MFKRHIQDLLLFTKAIHATEACQAHFLKNIEGVSIDSRTLQKGNLFVPIVRIDDGHNYVRRAFENGAAASLWQEDHGAPPEDLPIIIVKDTLAALQNMAREYRNQLNCKVVAVTGSNGKTTVKDMVTSILSTTCKVQKTRGNLNGEYGLPLTILELDEDTEVAVLEAGMSHVGEIKALSEIARPDIGIITMIGVSHLSNLGSREAIALAKLELLHGMNQHGVLLINGDEPLLTGALPELEFPETITVKTFGEMASNYYFSSNIAKTPNGLSFEVNTYDGAFFMPLLGSHNVWNALAAIAAADCFGVSGESVKKGLANLEISKMRMERIVGSGGFLIINDAWNASPVSMKAAIDTVAKLEGYSKKVLVLGDMLELGNEEMAFHEEIAECIDTSKLHSVFTFGRLSKVISDSVNSASLKGEAKHFTSKEELASECRRILTSDDVVLLKGSRGMKLEEVCDLLKI